MKKKTEKIHNLAKKIYLLCYIQPRYPSEISKTIYGNSNKKGIYQEIKKLEKNKWIKKIDINEIDKSEDKLDLSGQNAEKRHYYVSSYLPLKNAIVTKLKQNNITFNKKELNDLKNILNHDITKSVIEDIIKVNDLRKNIDLFDKILDTLNFFGIIIYFYANLRKKDFNWNKSFGLITRDNLKILKKLSKINKELSDFILELLEELFDPKEIIFLDF